LADKLRLFRVHFERGAPVEVSAEGPDEARAEARKRRPVSEAGIITKVKKVKDHG